MNRHALGGVGDVPFTIHRFSNNVQKPAQHLFAHGDGNRLAGIDRLGAAGQSVGGVHRDAADPVFS